MHPRIKNFIYKELMEEGKFGTTWNYKMHMDIVILRSGLGSKVLFAYTKTVYGASLPLYYYYV